MYIGFVLYLSLIALIWLFVRSKTCRNIVVGAIVFAVILGVIILPLHGAMADELFDLVEVSEFVSITPTVFDGVPCNIVAFMYHGKILSWYEDNKFYPEATYIIKIFNNIKVIDATIKELS